ncbi:hypothetical protein AB1I63_03950 [Streptococcus pneumoniae]
MKIICLSGFGQRKEVWEEVARFLSEDEIQVAFSYDQTEGLTPFETMANNLYPSLKDMKEPYILVCLPYPWQISLCRIAKDWSSQGLHTS